MLFSNDERLHLIAALKTYDEAGLSYLKPEVLHKISASALAKLNSLTGITHFTKQELTVLASATYYAINCLLVSNVSVSSEAYALYDRLLTLSESSD